MHFYSHLITIQYPFVILNTKDITPPIGHSFLITYTGAQVVTHNNDFVTAEEE